VSPPSFYSEKGHGLRKELLFKYNDLRETVFGKGSNIKRDE
jgi:hypothetical protein